MGLIAPFCAYRALGLQGLQGERVYRASGFNCLRDFGGLFTGLLQMSMATGSMRFLKFSRTALNLSWPVEGHGGQLRPIEAH